MPNSQERIGLSEFGQDGLRTRLRISPESFLFTMLFALLAAAPGFGVDMTLPVLGETARSLDVSPSSAGLLVSSFMISFGIAPLFYGPLSDIYGRKRIIVFGCVLFTISSLAVAAAPSLALLIVFRVLEGTGAAAMTLAMIVMQDAHPGAAGRKKMSYVIAAISTSPLIAPSVGAAVSTSASWRTIYLMLALAGLLLTLAVWLGFAEPFRPQPQGQLRARTIIRSYIEVLKNPTCRGYLLAGAASFGVIGAYTTGSSLFFIQLKGLTSSQYGLIFGATSIASIVGTVIDGRLSSRPVLLRRIAMTSFVTRAIVAVALLAMSLLGATPLCVVVPAFGIIALAGGLTATTIIHGALQAMPRLAGAVSALTGCIVIMVGSITSALTSVLFDGRSAFSMTLLMAVCAILALVAYSAAASIREVDVKA
jgi:DHA1 family bicyclomycin/chloramphenicol resistance-like MFS transporter